LKESVSVGGGVVLPACAFDRNANTNNVANVPTANGSTEEKGAEDREKNEKVVVDKEGDAVMADEEKRRNATNIFHRDSGLFALDVTRTEGDLCEPLSPSTRIGREVWTTMSTAAASVTSPAPQPTTNESGGQSLISFNAKGTLERRSGRRMHMSMTATGGKSSLKYRSVPTYGDNSVTQMAMMEDDNVSQAVTHGGAGGMTLHSRWKSQFDDSEGSENETEMKGEQLQSPEHKQEDDAVVVAKDEGPQAVAAAPASAAGQSSPQRLLSPTKPMPREDPPKCPPPPLLTLKSQTEDAAAAGKGTNTTAAASTHSSTTTNTRSAVVIPPPPQLAPPPPPPDFVPLQHSASAPSMNPNAAAGTVAASETASGGRSPTTKGMSGFTPPPPPQFAPPPPPVTATLASAITATSSLFTRPSMAPTRPALQHSISSGCVGSGSSVDPHLLQERSSSRHLAAAQEDDEGRNEAGQDDEEEEDGEGDQQDGGEEEGEEEEEEEDYVRNEYVAAVCRYTTIVNDVPPGFDNEGDEERNGSSSTTRSGSNNNRGDSKDQTRFLTLQNFFPESMMASSKKFCTIGFFCE